MSNTSDDAITQQKSGWKFGIRGGQDSEGEARWVKPGELKYEPFAAVGNVVGPDPFNRAMEQVKKLRAEADAIELNLIEEQRAALRIAQQRLDSLGVKRAEKFADEY